MSRLKKSDLPIDLAEADEVCIGVAGPVEAGVFCRPPQINWTVDLLDATNEYSLKRAYLINDFLAQAYSCCSKLAADSLPIIIGSENPVGAIGVLGAGTGLGKALLLPTSGGGYLGGSSEGGHANFAIESEQEFKFARFVVEKFGGEYATWDDVVSGKGLSVLHTFLTGTKLEAAEVAQTFTENNETLSLFAKFYGRVCRNFALEVLATGGIYIAGGIAAKNPIVLQHPDFKKAFCQSRVHRDLLSKISIRLLDNEESGLWGAAQCAVQRIDY